MKNLLILDNDWTISEFNNQNFSKTIWDDLKKNIKSYITNTLNISESEYIDIIRSIQERWDELSTWFESYWIDRRKYFFETRKSLDPSKYIRKRNNQELDKIIRDKLYYNLMLTWAPKVRFYNVMDYLWINTELFNKIVTAEDFYNKTSYIKDFINNSDFEIENTVAIWDETWDISYIKNNWWIGVDINDQRDLLLLKKINDNQ